MSTSFLNVEWHNETNHNIHQNYYNESMLHDAPIKTITINVNKNGYQLFVKQECEPMPDFLLTLPGSNKSLNNNRSQPIFLEQQWSDHNAVRNDAIAKYIHLVLNHHKKEFDVQTFTMPSILPADTENNVNEADESNDEDFDWKDYAKKCKQNKLTQIKREKIDWLTKNNQNGLEFEENECDSCRARLIANESYVDGKCEACKEDKALLVSKMIIKQKERMQTENKDDEELEVKAFHGLITSMNDEEFYLTEWKNYPKSECSWVPNGNISAPKLKQRFKKKMEKNGNTICYRHTLFKSIVPCFEHPECDSKGFIDLRQHNIRYMLQ